LIQDHLKEMFSVIYTPTEGEAIQNYSRLFRRPHGCFLNIEDVERVDEDIRQWGTADDIDYIVVTGQSSQFTYPVIILTVSQMGKKFLE